MSSNNIKWAFNLFRSSSNTFKQSHLIFHGDQEILPPVGYKCKIKFHKD